MLGVRQRDGKCAVRCCAAPAVSWSHGGSADRVVTDHRLAVKVLIKTHRLALPLPVGHLLPSLTSNTWCRLRDLLISFICLFVFFWIPHRTSLFFPVTQVFPFPPSSPDFKKILPPVWAERRQRTTLCFGTLLFLGESCSKFNSSLPSLPLQRWLSCPTRSPPTLPEWF